MPDVTGIDTINAWMAYGTTRASMPSATAPMKSARVTRDIVEGGPMPIDRPLGWLPDRWRLVLAARIRLRRS